MQKLMVTVQSSIVLNSRQVEKHISVNLSFVITLRLKCAVNWSGYVFRENVLWPDRWIPCLDFLPYKGICLYQGLAYLFMVQSRPNHVWLFLLVWLYCKGQGFKLYNVHKSFLKYSYSTKYYLKTVHSSFFKYPNLQI